MPFMNKLLKSIFMAIIFFGCFCFTQSSEAANWCVRQDATGNESGADWTNAYTTLPATLVRGDTYFIADGSYASYTVDDAVSGTSLIIILKSTASAHGTDTGWDNSFGDDQAVFEGAGGMTGIINIITSYVVFDGVVGSGSNPDLYGFKIAVPTNCAQDNRMFGLPGVGYSSLNISNVTVSHVAVINCSSSYNYPQTGLYSYPASGSNITISYNYISNNNTNIQLGKWSNSSIANNYFNGNWSSSSNHGAQISTAGGNSNISLHNNIFKNTTGTGELSCHFGDQDWKIYNNLIVNSAGSLGFGNGSSAFSDNVKRFQIHHNTFVSASYLLGGFFVGTLTDVNADKSYAYNNLFFNSNNPRFDNSVYTVGAIEHTYNAHFNSVGTYDNSEGGTAQVDTGDPFIDSANNDYRLKTATSPGLTLLSPYNLDILGNTRGADGAWDRGAYEYSLPAPVDAAPPAAPRRFKVK